MTVRFGAGYVASTTGEYGRWVQAADNAGLDLLICGDSQSLWPECYTLATLAATLTERPELAITVTNPRTRHAAVTAAAAASVQQVSNGRFHVGLGSGDSAIRNLGMRVARVDEIEEYAVAIREATAGRRACWQGRDFSLDWLGDTPRVPVWIAAEGPRSQRMAGRIADGVVLANSLTEERFSVALDNIREGANEVGRSTDEIEIWCFSNIVFAPDEKQGVDSIASVVVGMANHTYRFTMEGKGLPPELEEPMRRLMAEYDSRYHAQPGQSNPNEALLDKYGLRDYIARQNTIAGPPEQCIERIREIAAFGASNLITSQFSFATDQGAWLRTFNERVLPAFR
jgi:5,10-methylenetetrahydromethanopterin reductase